MKIKNKGESDNTVEKVVKKKDIDVGSSKMSAMRKDTRIDMTEHLTKDDIRKMTRESQKKRFGSNIKFEIKRRAIHFWEYIKFSSLKEELRGYGFEYTLKDFVKSMLIAAGVIIGASLLFRLKIGYIILICAVLLLGIPKLIRLGFRYVYEHRRFDDVVDYICQMLYSFKRNPKIISALQEALDQSGVDTQGDRMAKAIRSAIAYIERGKFEKNLYAEALQFIEVEYPCERIRALHRFLIDIEETGNEFKTSAEVLIEDANNWKDSTYLIQKERKKLRNVTTIIILGCMGCSLSTMAFIPTDFGAIWDKTVYQIGTTAMLMLFAYLYIYVCKKLTTSWLREDDHSKDEEILRTYKQFKEYDMKHERKKSIIKGAMFLILVPIALSTDSPEVLIVVGVMEIYYFTIPERRYKRLRRTVESEIEKAFPQWLRTLILLLQSNNVYVALVKSLNNIPVIIKEEVEILIKRLEDDPESMQPYKLFMKDFKVNDVKDAVKTIYGVVNYGSEDANNQLNAIIIRNAKLSARAEKVAEEEYTSIFKIISLVPELVVGIKMIVDLFMYAEIFLEYTQGLI